MSQLDDALGVLLDPSLAHVVEMVLLGRDGLVEAHTRDGATGFTGDGPRWVRGADPLARQDPSAYAPLDAELAALRPEARRNHYPYAYATTAHLFDDPRAPDLAVVHTGAHNWEERGGHRGEHGSLGVIQARAPLILFGTGVRALGRVDAAARMVDVAPTIAAMLGVAPRADGTLLAGQDGRVLTEALDGERPEQVVAFLCDGTNANVLYAMADAGELPNVRRLIDGGTTYGWGLVASFPTVTLANHTTALTGVHPGRHGVLHNAYYDRATARQIVTNAPETWHLARDEMRTDVETVHEAIARSGLGASASINEPCDRGATYSTFDFLRSGDVTQIASALPAPGAAPGTTAAHAEVKREYGWASSADFMAVQQATQVLASHPRFVWINLILPDAANHAGGPHSEIGYAGLRDTDARLGEILDAVEREGIRTAYVLLADHGMEQTDPACTGDFDEALLRAGIRFRDEAYGFIYLEP